MSSKFHLRPVSEGSISPSTSTITSERSPPFRSNPTVLPPQAAAPVSRPRRPLSPSLLRDVDLSGDKDAGSRRYPAPPTGHELMALFPPAPPINHRPGPTSGYFQQEERAFFARRGKEIVRVQIEVDMPRRPEEGDSKARGREPPTASRQWPPVHPQAAPPPSHATDQRPPIVHAPSAPFPPPPPNTGRRGIPVIPVPTQPAFPVPQSMHAGQPHQGIATPVDVPHAGYPMRPPPQEHHHAVAAVGTQMEAHPDEYRDDPDESWRRPMPHNERRRAGKHTKRVIVK